MILRYLFIIFFTVISVAASEITIDNILLGMEKYEEKISDINMEFEQEMEFTSVEEKYLTKCKLIYEKPDKIFYEQISPQKIQIVSNGKKIYIYNVANNQIFVETWKNWESIRHFIPGIIQPVTKISELKKLYNFKLHSTENDSYVLYVIPKIEEEKGKNVVGKFEMYIWVDIKEFYPKKTLFIGEGVKSTIQISKWEINKSPDKNLFKFKMPKNAEVIQLK